MIGTRLRRNTPGAAIRKKSVPRKLWTSSHLSPREVSILSPRTSASTFSESRSSTGAESNRAAARPTTRPETSVPIQTTRASAKPRAGPIFSGPGTSAVSIRCIE